MQNGCQIIKQRTMIYLYSFICLLASIFIFLLLYLIVKLWFWTIEIYGHPYLFNTLFIILIVLSIYGVILLALSA